MHFLGKINVILQYILVLHVSKVDLFKVQIKIPLVTNLK